MINRSGPERRNKPRIKETFPATVRGVDINGHPFKTETELDNLSASGLHLRLNNSVEEGTKLSIVVQFANQLNVDGPSARMAADGVVLRAEKTHNGSYGLGVLFTKYRFL
jgi:PilZ domain-containing protein